MCLMKPNYDVVNHLDYQRKIIVKWLQQLTEWTDLNTDIMTEAAYLFLMGQYKDLYEIWSDPQQIGFLLGEDGIKQTCYNIEIIFEYLEDLYERLKTVDKDDYDYKPISCDNEDLQFYFDDTDVELEELDCCFTKSY